MGAQEAGIKKGDVIIRIDDALIRKFSDLTGYLGSKRPEDIVDVTVFREGEKLSIPVKLKRTPFINYYGMRLRDMSNKELENYKIKSGVYISGVQNRRLSIRGIKKGHLLISVNGESISSKDDVLALNEESINELEFMNTSGEKMRFIFE